MTYLDFAAQQRRTVSAHLVGLVALCSLAACQKNSASGWDASATVPGSDASSIGTGSDAPATAAGSDVSPTVAGSDSSPLSTDNFPITFANAVCSSIAACCQKVGLVSSSCQATLQAVVAAWVTKNTSDPKVAFDPDAAARCIEVTRTGFTACTDRDLAKQSNSSCNQMVRGTVPLGGSCTDGSQCIRPTDGVAECDAGVCTAGSLPTFDNPRGTLGDPCKGTCRPTNCSWSGTSSAALCWTEDGLYCPYGVCVATPAIGQPCYFYCGKDAHCADDGLCAPNLTTGPCESNDDCLAQAYCDRPSGAISGQCTLLKDNGATCSSAKECASGQCLNAACRPWSMANDNVCSGVIF